MYIPMSRLRRVDRGAYFRSRASAKISVKEGVRARMFSTFLFAFLLPLAASGAKTEDLVAQLPEFDATDFNVRSCLAFCRGRLCTLTRRRTRTGLLGIPRSSGTIQSYELRQNRHSLPVPRVPEQSFRGPCSHLASRGSRGVIPLRPLWGTRLLPGRQQRVPRE